MILTTLADIRELVERHLPAECRERENVADQMNAAGIAVRLVLRLKQVPCLPQ
jgi:hypothetical protein